MQQGIFLDLEVYWEGVFVPAEKYAIGDGFDIHGGRFYDLSVFRGILDDFFVEHLVFAPARDGIELVEAIGKRGNMEIALHKFGRVTILFARFEFFANQKL